jgi:hypothetical protein
MVGSKVETWLVISGARPRQASDEYQELLPDSSRICSATSALANAMYRLNQFLDSHVSNVLERATT